MPATTTGPQQFAGATSPSSATRKPRVPDPRCVPFLDGVRQAVDATQRTRITMGLIRDTLFTLSVRLDASQGVVRRPLTLARAS